MSRVQPDRRGRQLVLLAEPTERGAQARLPWRPLRVLAGATLSVAIGLGAVGAGVVIRSVLEVPSAEGQVSGLWAPERRPGTDTTGPSVAEPTTTVLPAVGSEDDAGGEDRSQSGPSDGNGSGSGGDGSGAQGGSDGSGAQGGGSDGSDDNPGAGSGSGSSGGDSAGGDSGSSDGNNSGSGGGDSVGGEDNSGDSGGGGSGSGSEDNSGSGGGDSGSGEDNSGSGGGGSGSGDENNSGSG